MQKRDDFENMVLGKHEAIHVLPCLQQLYPDIEFLSEESGTLKPGSARNRAAWVMAGKRLYFLDKSGKVLYHPNPCVLLASFLN